jgi:hypothetical protein
MGFSIPGMNVTLPVCPGFDDMDRDAACMIVGAGLLLAAPFAVYSLTFKIHGAKSMLCLWIALLAISHVFCAVNATDRGVHYQICPTGHVEELPGTGYQANISMNGMLRALRNVSNLNQCLYTCFASDQYPIRSNSDLSVFSPGLPGLSLFPAPSTRKLGLAFWIIYGMFSIIALLIVQPRLILPIVHLLDYYRPGFKEHWAISPKVNLWVVRLKRFIQILSGVMFIGYVIFLEVTHRGVPESETPAAVGQWGALVVVLLVLIGSAVKELVCYVTECNMEADEEDGKAMGKSATVQLTVQPVQD